MITEKRCCHCKEIKPVSEFYLDKNTKDGIRKQCKKCICDSGREKYDPEKSHKYYEKRKDVILSRMKRNYSPDKNRVKREKRIEKVKEEMKEYKKKNRELIRFLAKLHEHRKKSNGGSFSLKQWTNLVEYYCPDGKCLCCKKFSKMTIDHIIPVSKGGTNYIDNIQPLCLPCNSRKNNKVTIDYRPDKGEFAKAMRHNKTHQTNFLRIAEEL